MQVCTPLCPHLFSNILIQLIKKVRNHLAVLKDSKMTGVWVCVCMHVLLSKYRHTNHQNQCFAFVDFQSAAE